MKKIVLHIGTFKTGSTALQFHMHKNREMLYKNGYYYGDYFDNYYLHSNLCYGLLEEALKEYDIFEQYKNHPRFINVSENPEDIIERINVHSKNCTGIIISHEAFFADAFRTLIGLRTEFSDTLKRNINMYMRRRLKSLLESICDEIEIVCYLRRQDLFIESQYNQFCKDIWYGEKDKKLPTFEEFIQYKPIELNYFQVLEEWKEVFSDSKILVKPYEKEAFKDGLINDFYINVLEIDKNQVDMCSDIRKSESNMRIDRDVLEYKKELEITDARLNQLLKEYSIELDKINDYGYFSNVGREKFLKQYESENRNVAINYLNNAEGQLFQNMNLNYLQYEGLTKDKILAITKWLFARLLK